MTPVLFFIVSCVFVVARYVAGERPIGRLVARGRVHDIPQRPVVRFKRCGGGFHRVQPMVGAGFLRVAILHG